MTQLAVHQPLANAHTIFSITSRRAEASRWILAILLLTVFAGAAESIPATGTLYGTDANAGNLIVINPVDGSATVLGPIGISSIPSLAVDPTTGILYAGTGGANGAKLYQLNPFTGAGTLIGDTGLGQAAIGGMDFAPDGTLYATINLAGNGNTGADHLATLDLNNGAATLIGPFGNCNGVTVPTTGGGTCTVEGIEAIAFDEDGTLWGSHSDRGASGSPGLYQINTTTGTALFLLDYIDDSGNAPSGGVVSLHFECDGSLLGGTARARSGFSDGGNLIRIFSASGGYQILGNSVAVGSLGGLSYTDFCEPTQTLEDSWGQLKVLYR